MVDQVLHKSLLFPDLFNSELQIAIEKYIAPIHSGGYRIAFLFMEIFVDNLPSLKTPNMLHVIPPIMVETTCALQVFPLFS
jgi:hypothetical protein